MSKEFAKKSEFYTKRHHFHLILQLSDIKVRIQHASTIQLELTLIHNSISHTMSTILCSFGLQAPAVLNVFILAVAKVYKICLHTIIARQKQRYDTLLYYLADILFLLNLDNHNDL